MNTNGYGRQAGVSARASLWIALALLAGALVLSSGWFDETQARVATQGTYCLRTGPHKSGMAMWPEDKGGSWHE